MPIPSLSRGCEIAQIYLSQTKILERMTKEEIRIFEALFKGVSTRFGLRTIEKCFENPDFLFCHSFQNLRLGGVKFFVRHIARNYLFCPRKSHFGENALFKSIKLAIKK
jgi:hypothetical protein